MKTIPYDTIVQRAAEATGRVFTELQNEEQIALNGFILGRTKEIWDLDFWPDLLRIERRWYEPDFIYGSGTPNSRGDIVFLKEDETYYISSKDTNSNVPDGTEDPTSWFPLATTYKGEVWEQGLTIVIGDIFQDPYTENSFVCIVAHTSTSGRVPSITPSFWQVLPFLQRIVAFDEPNETEIGDVVGVTREHPKRSLRTIKVNFQIVDTGVEILEARNEAYIEFKIPSPETLSTVDTAVIPFEFWPFIAYSSAGDLELSDGRAQNSELLYARAEGAKVASLDKLFRIQQQVVATTVVTAATPTHA